MATNLKKAGVLFVCVQNNAWSQIAEAFLNALAGDTFAASSAGFEPGTLDPLAVEVMQEVGIDISRNRTKKVFDLYRNGAAFTFLIAVYDVVATRRRPIFPGVKRTLIWSFADPASSTGSWERRLSQTRQVRDAIKAKIEEFIKDVTSGRSLGPDFYLKPAEANGASTVPAG